MLSSAYLSTTLFSHSFTPALWLARASACAETGEVNIKNNKHKSALMPPAVKPSIRNEPNKILHVPSVMHLVDA